MLHLPPRLTASDDFLHDVGVLRISRETSSPAWKSSIRVKDWEELAYAVLVLRTIWSPERISPALKDKSIAVLRAAAL